MAGDVSRPRRPKNKMTKIMISVTEKLFDHKGRHTASEVRMVEKTIETRAKVLALDYYRKLMENAR